MAKSKIYVAYRKTNLKRAKSIVAIRDLLVDFGFEAWCDDDLPLGNLVDSYLGEKMNWANNFLVVVHKDTHEGPTVKEEVQSAIRKQKDGKYEKVIALLCNSSHEDVEKLNTFLANRAYEKIARNNRWKWKLKQAFLVESSNLSTKKLEELIINNNLDKFKKLIEKTRSIKYFKIVEKDLNLLSAHLKEKIHRETYSKMISITIDRILRLEHETSKKPSRKVQTLLKETIDKLETNYGTLYVTYCKIIIGFINFVRLLDIRDATQIKKMYMLGVPKKVFEMIIDELVSTKIVSQQRNLLFIDDRKLGRILMNEVFFNKRPVVSMKTSKEVLYG